MVTGKRPGCGGILSVGDTLQAISEAAAARAQAPNSRCALFARQPPCHWSSVNAGLVLARVAARLARTCGPSSVALRPRLATGLPLHPGSWGALSVWDRNDLSE